MDIGIADRPGGIGHGQGTGGTGKIVHDIPALERLPCRRITAHPSHVASDGPRHYVLILQPRLKASTGKAPGQGLFNQDIIWAGLNFMKEFPAGCTFPEMLWLPVQGLYAGSRRLARGTYMPGPWLF